MGTIRQIQKLFKTIGTAIPGTERNNLLIIGDFNVNIENKDSPKVKYLYIVFGTPAGSCRNLQAACRRVLSLLQALQETVEFIKYKI